MKIYPRVLTIAGSDSGGGAGIQADIKTISATGSYAMSAITAVTVQNTVGVESVYPVPPSTIGAQIHSVLSDIGADAVKIGMLHSSEVIRTVRMSLEPYAMKNIVIDPVMVSTSGHRLIEESAIETLISELIPMARIITPNIPEAEVLLGKRITGMDELKDAAVRLSMNGRISVLMKAGHMEEGPLTDWLYNAEDDTLTGFEGVRIDTPNTHGTGCTLSSAIASYLSQGKSLGEAVQAAKTYISEAIRSGASFSIGHGHGPVDHFWKTRRP